MCLDIAAGTAIRFEPGIERPVDLVAVGGAKRIAGLRGKGR
jgi:urease beta subunit